MKTLLSFFCAIALVTLGPPAIGSDKTTAWEKYLEDLPEDAKKILKTRLQCNAFGGDELSAPEMKRWNKLGCAKSDKEFEALKKKYSVDGKVIRAMDCAEETIYAKDCP